MSDTLKIKLSLIKSFSENGSNITFTLQNTPYKIIGVKVGNVETTMPMDLIGHTFKFCLNDRGL